MIIYEINTQIKRLLVFFIVNSTHRNHSNYFISDREVFNSSFFFFNNPRIPTYQARIFSPSVSTSSRNYSTPCTDTCPRGHSSRSPASTAMWLRWRRPRRLVRCRYANFGRAAPRCRVSRWSWAVRRRCSWRDSAVSRCRLWYSAGSAVPPQFVVSETRLLIARSKD